MRMWMINPKIMCRQHLLGEHVELHMFVGSIIRGFNLDGYVKNNCLEYKSIYKRHDELAKEIIRRGYKHKSPLLVITKPNYYPQHIIESKVDIQKSIKDLITRCEKCDNNNKNEAMLL